jgi:hypothetical protein
MTICEKIFLTVWLERLAITGGGEMRKFPPSQIAMGAALIGVCGMNIFLPFYCGRFC